jgi:hypothetical protein
VLKLFQGLRRHKLGVAPRLRTSESTLFLPLCACMAHEREIFAFTSDINIFISYRQPKNSTG